MARSKVAEAVRQARIDEEQALTPAERVKLALELGERDLALYMAGNGISDPDEARKEIERLNQRGRRFSRCMHELLK